MTLDQQLPIEFFGNLYLFNLFHGFAHQEWPMDAHVFPGMPQRLRTGFNPTRFGEGVRRP